MILHSAYRVEGLGTFPQALVNPRSAGCVLECPLLSAMHDWISLAYACPEISYSTLGMVGQPYVNEAALKISVDRLRNRIDGSMSIPHSESQSPCKSDSFSNSTSHA